MAFTKEVRVYIERLTETTVQLISDGNVDPSAEEIAEAHFPEHGLVGEITESVRKRLDHIKKQIEIDYPQTGTLVLVNQKYYRLYRKRGVETDTEALECLPHNGDGNMMFGIRRCSRDDRIWKADVRRNQKTGAGKVRKTGDRVLLAHGHGDASDEDAAAILRESLVLSQPTNVEKAQQLLSGRKEIGQGEEE